MLEKSGIWIAHGSERIGQGREAARQYLVEHVSGYAMAIAFVATGAHGVMPIAEPACKPNKQPAR